MSRLATRLNVGTKWTGVSPSFCVIPVEKLRSLRPASERTPKRYWSASFGSTPFLLVFSTQHRESRNDVRGAWPGCRLYPLVWD